MNVLINSAEKVSNSLQNYENRNDFTEKELVKLLKEKIEEAMTNDISVVAIITNSFTECRNVLYIEYYELDENYLYINDNNFEIHINSNSVTEIKYDNTYDEQFVITCGENKVTLIF